jgi:hypothetical protein
MKLMRRSLIIVVVVLLLAVFTGPVVAAPEILVLKPFGPFGMTFTVNGCTVTTLEYATQHFLLGKMLFSTNTGTATASGTCALGGLPIEPSVPVPFAVVDIANWPWNDTIIRTYGIYVGPDAFYTPGGPLQRPALVAGVSAKLIKFSPRTYAGYGYLSMAPNGYTVLPFQIETSGLASYAGGSAPLSSEMLK